jgi:hypothetical protein
MLAAHHMDLFSRQQILSTAKATTLASDAACFAAGKGHSNLAVEFVEAAHSIFWSQALHLRTPLDDLAIIQPDLAAKLASLAKQLEQASFRDTSRNRLTDTQHKIISSESEGRHCQQLNEQWDEMIKEVRHLPGFEDFMRPKAINVLKQAAVSGPIIILTTTDSTCFALIVTATNKVQCLRLLDMSLPKVKVLADLVAHSSQAFDPGPFFAKYGRNTHREEGAELLDRVFAGRERSVDLDSDDVFQALLIYLWEMIVKPVFSALDLEVSINIWVDHILSYVPVEIR